MCITNIIKSAICGMVGIFISTCGVDYAYSQEAVTLSTYYPSPYGIYKTLRLYPSADAVFNALCTNKGEMSYSSTDDELYICSKDPANPAQNIWQTPGEESLWTLDGVNNRLYPNETTWNVGIGTTTPTSKLHVAGGDLTVQTGQGIVLGGVKKTVWPGYGGTVQRINVSAAYHENKTTYCPSGFFMCGIRLQASDEDIAHGGEQHETKCKPWRSGFTYPSFCYKSGSNECCPEERTEDITLQIICCR